MVPMVGHVADGELHAAAGPLEHAAGEVQRHAAGRRIEVPAAELHRARAGAGERPAVGDGVPARQVDDGPLADVESDPAGVGPALDVHGRRRAPTLNVVPPENVPSGLRSTVIPWGNWGTVIVPLFPEVGSGSRMPLPIWIEDPAPLTETVLPVACEGGRRREGSRAAPPLTSIVTPPVAGEAGHP